MTEFVAFLRGINVGGHNVVKMEELRSIFVNALGFNNVSSYKASGNLLFESSQSDHAAITELIERELRKKSAEPSGGVRVFVRTLKELQGIVRQNPFESMKPGASTKPYVTFLESGPTSGRLALPLKSPKGDVEVILIRNRAAFSLSHLKNGRFGYPNSFLEKTLRIAATTRDWKTIVGISSDVSLHKAAKSDA